jgi:glycosyltransferase involved in cell wall biosynthesis
MSPPHPHVSFLLPVHNAAATLGATMDSIFAQTFRDFELVVMDDASTDDTPALLQRIRNPRLRVHRNSANLELTRTLNLGLSMVRGPYIARIDADDLCMPERLQRQVAFLDDHPDVGVVGSFVETFSADEPPGSGQILRYPAEPLAAAATLLFRSPLAHPAVMIRRAALEQHGLRYDETFRRGQDYDLWMRFFLTGLPMANIPEVLLRYRVHAAQASRLDAGGVFETGAIVRQRLLEKMGMTPTPEELAMHEALSWDQLVADPRWLAAAVAWLERLLPTNQTGGIFDTEALGRVLCGRWVRTVKFARQVGVPLPTEGPLAQYLTAGALETS